MLTTVTRAMKLKLYPTQDQLAKIRQHCGSTRYVYNYFLAINKQRYDSGLPIHNYVACANLLVELKKTEQHSWMSTIHSQTLQQACKRLDTAYTNFFREMKSGNVRQRPPVFKTRRDSVQSFCYPQGVRFNDARTRIFLPKIGYVRCRGYRQFSNPKYKTLTIKLHNDGLVEATVSLVADNVATVSPTWRAVGIDVGTRVFLTDSDGYSHPSLVNKKELNKLVKLQRQLANSTPKSENQRRMRAMIAKQYRRIANIRLNTLHHLANRYLVYKNVYVEHLDIKQMTASIVGTIDEPNYDSRQKRMLNRAVMQQGWGIFFSILQYKLTTQDSLFYQVEAYGTSQECHVCGNVDKSSRNGKWYTCVACGNHCDADYNAGINIRNRGYNIRRLIPLSA